MTPGRQFGIILLSVVTLAALVSHATAKWVGIDTRQGGNSEFGRTFHSAPVLLAGSSMIGVAIDWNQVAIDLSRPIEEVSTASASPCELETLTRSVPDANLIVVGVSLYELDEQFIADFRADIVPINQTADDLWESHANWPFFKRTMSRYPLAYLQRLFPTAGRSLGIMVGVRSKLRWLGRLAGKEATEALPTVQTTGNSGVPTTRVTDWPQGRLLRNLSEMRSGCRGLHGFNGPKHLAFARLIRRLATQGKVVVVVLPVSPAYETGLLKPADKLAFENSLEEVAKQAPEVKWIRIDQLPELQTTDVFTDLMHVNLAGRQVATAAFREKLSALMRAP